MSFNADKCFVMKISNKPQPPDRQYTFCGKELQVVTSHPYLGIEIDKKISWKPHIDNTTAKANKVLGCLRRNLWFCSRRVKETAYKTLVLPILEYGSTAWGPYQENQITRLEAVQRKAARFCMSDYKQKSSVTKMITELGWETLDDRRKKKRLTMMYKISNELVGINKGEHLKPIINSKTRKKNSMNYHPIYARLNTYKHSYFPRTIHEWNTLGDSTVTATSIDAFKDKLDNPGDPPTTDASTTTATTTTTDTSTATSTSTEDHQGRLHN